MKLSLENQLCMFNLNFPSGKPRNDINLGGRKSVFGLEQQVEAEGFRTVGWQDEGSQYPWGALGTRNGRDTPVHGTGHDAETPPRCCELLALLTSRWGNV